VCMLCMSQTWIIGGVPHQFAFPLHQSACLPSELLSPLLLSMPIPSIVSISLMRLTLLFPLLPSTLLITYTFGVLMVTSPIQGMRTFVNVSTMLSLRMTTLLTLGTKGRNSSLQDNIGMECGKVLYSTTKKGRMLEKER